MVCPFLSSTSFGSTKLLSRLPREVKRRAFNAHDGGKWVFDQEGARLPFEDEQSCKARLVRDRFPKTLLQCYLHEPGASLEGSRSSGFEHGPGKLIVKSGRMPHDLTAFHD